MRITEVLYIKDFTLQVTFANGKKMLADYKSFLAKALNPMTSKYYNVKKFKNVKLDNGFLSWGNGEMEIPGESIYKGNFNPISKALKNQVI